jgi:hypothetical protein
VRERYEGELSLQMLGLAWGPKRPLSWRKERERRTLCRAPKR